MGRILPLLIAGGLGLAFAGTLFLFDWLDDPNNGKVQWNGVGAIRHDAVDPKATYAAEILRGNQPYDFVPGLHPDNHTIVFTRRHVEFEANEKYDVKLFNTAQGTHDRPNAPIKATLSADFVLPMPTWAAGLILGLTPPSVVFLVFGVMFGFERLADAKLRRGVARVRASQTAKPVEAMPPTQRLETPIAATAAAAPVREIPAMAARPASRPNPVVVPTPPVEPPPSTPTPIHVQATVVGAESRKKIPGVLAELVENGQRVDARYSDATGHVDFGEFERVAALRVRTVLQRQGFVDADVAVPARGAVELPVSYKFAPTAAQSGIIEEFHQRTTRLVNQCQPYSRELAAILRKSAQAYSECLDELKDPKLFLTTPHDPGRLLEALFDDANAFLTEAGETLQDKSIVNLLAAKSSAVSTTFSLPATSRALRQTLLVAPEGYPALLTQVANQFSAVDHQITVLTARNDMRLQSRLWQEFQQGLSRPASTPETLAARWFGGRLRAGILEHLTHEKPWVDRA